MIGGYTGKTLRIDLTDQRAVPEATNFDLASRFIGGRGYCAKLLFDEVPQGTDPLSPGNKIIFGTGPANGTPVCAANRFVLVTKSPETGLFLDSYAGGNFSAELKFAGYDFVIIEGRAEKPVYLWIQDNKIQFRPASRLWGTSTWEAETLLKKEVGDEAARVAVIGPAGENLSNLALVSTDYYHQCGRGGIGAVFGSKNLKAIVIRGSQGVRIAKPQVLLDYLLTDLRDKVMSLAQHGELRMKFGTPLSLTFTSDIGILPTYNFKYGQFEGTHGIDCHAVRRLVTADNACFVCNTGCIKVVTVREGRFSGTQVGGPEQETLALLGANVGVDSIEAVIHANVLCDSLGLDTIGAGNVIAWAMECYEKGILTREDTGGLDLSFGNVEAVMKLLHMMAFREGLGDLLTQGVRRAAEKIGQGSDEFAMCAKGLEYPAYRPGPVSPAFGLNYAVADRGGCHRRAWPTLEESATLKPFSSEGRAALIKRLYDQRIPWHCAVTCDMPLFGIGHKEASTLLSAVTGWELTEEEMQKLSDRVASLVRAYNVREGASRADDTLAPRSFLEDTAGPGSGKALTREMLDEMLDDYYSLRGWDRDGVPTRETLLKLDLSKEADELEKCRKRAEGRPDE